MPNIKISAAADAGTLLSSDMLPLARSGDTNAYHATMAEISTYTTAGVASGAYGNVGRNLLHNPLFNVAQRGAGGFTASGYTLDRWALFIGSGDTTSFQQFTATDGTRSQIGDEAVSYIALNTFTGGAAAGNIIVLQQKIENVQRLSGKTVTVSCHAAAGSGAPKLGVSIDQNFGTGGSPSAAVSGAGQAVTLSTTYTRYSLTFTLPSIAGKTLGTNGDSCTTLNIWYSAGSTYASGSGIGVQSGAISLWGVQLEIGSVATPLEKPDPQQDLAKCQRFYQVATFQWAGYAAASTSVQTTQLLPVTMRALPSITPSYTQQVNCGSSSLAAAGYAAGIVVSTTVTASSGYLLAGTFTASADL